VEQKAAAQSAIEIDEAVIAFGQLEVGQQVGNSCEEGSGAMRLM
jgi:hypothetical protein